MKSQIPESLKRVLPLNLSDAARYLGVHQNTLKNYEKQGLLQASFRLPKRGDRRYTIEDLNRFRRRYWRKLK